MPALVWSRNWDEVGCTTTHVTRFGGIKEIRMLDCNTGIPLVMHCLGN